MADLKSSIEEYSKIAAGEICLRDAAGRMLHIMRPPGRLYDDWERMYVMLNNCFAAYRPVVYVTGWLEPGVWEVLPDEGERDETDGADEMDDPAGDDDEDDAVAGWWG